MRYKGRLLSCLGVALLISACSEDVAPGGELRALDSGIEIRSAEANLPTDGVFPQAVGGQPFTITVRLDGTAPAGGVEIGVSILRVNSFVASFGGSGGTVVVPEGEQMIEIPIETFPVSALNTESISVSTDSEGPTDRSRERLLIQLLPDPERPVQVNEAEDAALKGAATVDEMSSFSGVGAVEFPLGEAASATFDVDVAETGAYLLILGYAGVPGPPAPGEPSFVDLNVNGESSRLTLPSPPGTGGGSGVRNEGVQVQLSAGRNVIRLSADEGSDLGAFALDRLDVVASDTFSNDDGGDVASGDGGFPEPGVAYALRNAATGTYLDTDPNGQLELASSATGADRHFRLAEVGSAFFVVNQRSDRGALDTRSGGGVRWISEPGGGDDKRWALVREGEGYRLDNLADRGYLSVSDGEVVLSGEEDEASLWFFESD